MTMKPLVSSVKVGKGRNNEERMSVMGMRCGLASLFAERAAVPVRESAGGPIVVVDGGVCDGRRFLHCLQHFGSDKIVSREFGVPRSRH
jgi:hypothetical protein